jgi:hypothetical protein
LQIYRIGGIDVTQDYFADNQPILELIAAKPAGILLLLDQQCKMGGAGSDTGFLGSLFKSHQVGASAKDSKASATGGGKVGCTGGGRAADKRREVPLSRPRPRFGKGEEMLQIQRT